MRLFCLAYIETLLHDFDPNQPILASVFGGRMVFWITTMLKAKGGYTDEEKDVIYAVVTRLEVTKLKKVVYETDPDAFITIINTQETRGAKFKAPIY